MKKRSIAVIVAVLMLVSLLAGCVQIVQPSSSSSKASSRAPRASEAPANNSKDYFTVGDTATIGSWQITLNDENISESVTWDDGETFTVDPDNDDLYAVFDFTVQHTSDDVEIFLPAFPRSGELEALFKAASNYEPDMVFLSDVTAGSLFDVEFDGRETMSGQLVFLVSTEDVEWAWEGNAVELVFTQGSEKVVFSDGEGDGGGSAAPNGGGHSPYGDWSTVYINDLVIDIDDVESASSYSGTRASSGNQFILVWLTVENEGDSEQFVFPRSGIMEDVVSVSLIIDGSEYLMTGIVDSENLASLTLKPGESVSGYLSFEIPTGVADDFMDGYTDGYIRYTFGDESVDVGLLP